MYIPTVKKRVRIGENESKAKSCNMVLKKYPNLKTTSWCWKKIDLQIKVLRDFEKIGIKLKHIIMHRKSAETTFKLKLHRYLEKKNQGFSCACIVARISNSS